MTSNMIKNFNNSLLTRGFTETECKEFLNAAKAQHFFKDQIVFNENDLAEHLYLLSEGKVIIERLLSTPNLPISKQIFTVKKGQIFGEMGLVEDVNRTATARAASQVKVICMEYKTLKELFDTNPGLGYKFMTNLAVILGTRLRNLNKQLNNSHIRKHMSLEFEYYG